VGSSEAACGLELPVPCRSLTWSRDWRGHADRPDGNFSDFPL